MFVRKWKGSLRLPFLTPPPGEENQSGDESVQMFSSGAAASAPAMCWSIDVLVYFCLAPKRLLSVFFLFGTNFVILLRVGCPKICGADFAFECVDRSLFVMERLFQWFNCRISHVPPFWSIEAFGVSPNGLFTTRDCPLDCNSCRVSAHACSRLFLSLHALRR
jgi:hypothetical protein